ncbi:MAG: SDR family NAD(P)-dependent oxidoreductase [Planctomycetes bacterium]|nr:SDR family NAD(P)-dependent oxidoreductase [Planctomycetota bacterium]
MSDATPKMKMEPLAIVGAGCFFPGSEGFEAFWSFVKSGKDGITKVPASHWNPEDYFDKDPKFPDKVYSQTGGFISPVDFSPGDFGIAPNNLEATDTSQLLGLMAAKQALEHAGYQSGIGEQKPGLKPLDRSRASVILGVTGTLELVIPLGARLGHPRWRKALSKAGVDDATTQKIIDDISASYVPWQENSFPGLLGNVVAGRIANRFDFGGTNCVVDAACASSLGALHLAALELWSHRSDMVISGGVDTFNDIFMFMCFSKTPALSPTGHSRPFDAEGDGTVLGEGLGLFVLKRLSDAEKAGDNIIAVLRSVGTSSDGKGGAVYAPRAEGQMNALRAAYQEAGISPDSIDLVEAHGTGTKVGDATELSSLLKVFQESGKKGSWCAVGSIKSQIGHTKAAAGAAGFLKAAAALYHKVLPPSIKVRKPLEGMNRGKGPFYFSGQKRPWISNPNHPRRAAVSAFGFGGSNFHCVLEEYQKTKSQPDWDGNTQILSLCAASKNELMQKLDALNAQPKWEEWRRDCFKSRSSFDHRMDWRLLLITRKGESDIAQVIQKTRESLIQFQKDKPLPPGVFIEQGQHSGKLAFLFSGQGAQYPGMLLDLSCLFPEMLDAFEKAHSLQLKNQAEAALLIDLIYPQTTFDPKEAEQDLLRLQDTLNAQPALGVIELGAMKVLSRFGLKPDLTAGHSFGELAALACAGAFTEDQFLDLAFQRGKCMANASTGNGGMIAVLALEKDVAALFEANGISLVPANRNTLNQIVYAGPIDQIDLAEKVLASNGFKAKKLQVGGAFHSPMVANAEQPFLKFIQSNIQWNSTKVPVYANSTASVYPTENIAANKVLAGQLAKSVEFSQMISTMHRDGATTFVEIGPGGRLSGLVSEILKGQKHNAISLDASQGKKAGEYDLAVLLCKVAALGLKVDLAKWDDSFVEAPVEKHGFTVALTGANYVRKIDKVEPRMPSVPKVDPVLVAPVKVVSEKVIETKVVPPLSSSRPIENPKIITPTMTPPVNQEVKSVTMSNRNVNSEGIGRVLDVTKASLDMLQKLQEQSSQIHKMFLEGQESAQRNLHALIQQQQIVLQASLGLNHQMPQIKMEEKIQAGVSSVPASPASFVAETVVSNVARPMSPVNVAEVVKTQPVPTPAIVRPQPAPVVPAPVVAAPFEAPALSNQTRPTVGAIPSVLMMVVSEKTGYPTEMLELDMALDADLGIDSIKRVEILAAIQERLPDAPIVKPEHLGSLNTLREVAEFLQGAKVADLNVEVKTIDPVVTMASVVPRKTNTTESVLIQVVSEKTGYPTEMLELDMALDADLGIDSIKRVEILAAIQEKLPEAPIVKPEHLGTLNTLREVLNHLDGGGVQQKEPALEVPPAKKSFSQPSIPTGLDRLVPRLAKVAGNHGTISIDKQILVTGSDAELAIEVCNAIIKRGFKAEKIALNEVINASWDRLGGLIILSSPLHSNEDFLLKSLMAVQSVGKALRSESSSSGSILFAVTRLDGALGFESFAEDRNPLDAGLLGLVKTASREWPHIRSRAIDLDPRIGIADAAEKIAEEILFHGPIEVAINSTGRRTIQLDVSQVEPPLAESSLEGRLVLVTGGARGVTAECAQAIADLHSPSILVLGRSPEPTDEPEWLINLHSEMDIKKVLATRSGATLSPKAIGEQCKQILANREVRQNLKKLGASCSKVLYRSVDIRNAASVLKILAEVQSELGPVCGIIHGAGVLADALIEDKTAEQFHRVFATKVTGLQNILSNIDIHKLNFLALFSSTTARFGRTGQVDYAMANEVLNKMAQKYSRMLKNTRVVSFNWGPWEGGMVGEGLKKLFLKEGVGLIPLKEGAALLACELLANNSPVEVSVLAKGSSFPCEEASSNLNSEVPVLLTFERRLDLLEHPFLEHHVIDGRPVLPMAMMLEWLAHAALHENPGYQFHGCDDFRILHGVICDQPEPLHLRFITGVPRSSSLGLIIPVEARSFRNNGKDVLHARADILLVEALPGSPANIRSITAPKVEYLIDDLYRDVLFHGRMMQCLENVESCGERGITCWVKGAPEPSEWIRQPLRQRWILDPLGLDAILQMMIVWTSKMQGMGSLPCRIGSLRLFRKPVFDQKLKGVLEIRKANELHAVADVDMIDPVFGVVMRLEGVEGVLDASLARAFRKNRLGKPATI